MNIPNFLEIKIVDSDGKFTAEAAQMFSQLFTQLQVNLSKNGYYIPSQTSQNIARMNNSDSNNILVIDSDTNQLKINLNGTFKTITVT